MQGKRPYGGTPLGLASDVLLEGQIADKETRRIMELVICKLIKRKLFNIPSQLKGWKTDAGDPCVESWTGVTCNDSSVIHLSWILAQTTFRVEFRTTYQLCHTLKLG
ncbi:hypothetical protein POM88_042974 [Heracleum sosnowskyi]|uniref:Leucine-rich repeat-containing N-terminal plant-type domain-containing protein n=1 Tax=Heracleum sosnowskyi TaxID=360622 RepID=A0AAD8MCM9_9APIA|nr:hypothetical protein POM88_042974 [Heracleum sosnowskyi]